MNYIKGKLKKLIFYSKESGFVVALFRVKESNLKEIEVNKTITITGSFLDPSIDVPMTLYGSYKKNDKWVCRGKEITPFFVSSCHVFFDGHNDCSEKGIID